MKKLLLLLIIPFLSFGQEWEQVFGGANYSEGYSVQQTSDGGYIVTGYTSFGSNQSQTYLIKTFEDGSLDWYNTFYGNGNMGRSVQQTDDGGYIISSGEYLIKTYENGDQQWSIALQGSSLSVQQTDDGGYISTGGITGLFYSPPINYDVDVYLIKTNSEGVEEWSQTFGGEYSDFGKCVQQTDDGGYIICGETRSYNENKYRDVYLIKTDSEGVEEWSKIFGGTQYDAGFFVQQTNDLGYIITGYTNSFGNGSSDVYLIKTNENGDEQWSQTFGGTQEDQGRSVQQTTDGGYVITGYTESFGNGFSDVYLVKTDENGDEQCFQTFGDESGFNPIDNDCGHSVKQTTDGGYIIVGQKQTEEVPSNVYLIKVDECENIISTIELPTIKKNLITTVDILGRPTNTNKGLQLHIYDDGSVEKKYLIK